jgi:hypothetical protein
MFSGGSFCFLPRRFLRAKTANPHSKMIPHGINTPRNIGVLSLALGLFMIVTVVVLVVFDWVEDGGVIDLVGVTKTVEVD